MIIAVVGTGTGIGKTHVAVALLHALRERGLAAAGWKPVESGVTGQHGEDELALRQASAGSGGELSESDVPPTLRLAAPLAPNLAARVAGTLIDGEALRERLVALAARWPTLVLELAGGWCSPFDDEQDNAEWLAALPQAIRGQLRLVLVAPDRLGVLHDVSAAVRAAAVLGLTPHVLALSATGPAATGAAAPRLDASVGLNAAELSRRQLTREIPVVSLPYAPSRELARSEPVRTLVAHVLGEPR